MHPFEKAGLGKAPFRCIAVETKWHHNGDGTKKPGGSCHYCGTGILYCFKIEGTDGKTFVVGSDCVLKTHAEVDGFKAYRSQLAREKRAAGRRARVEARLAQWEAERVQRRSEFEAAHPEVCSFLDKLLADADPEAPTGFMVEMARVAQRFGSLTAGQLAAVKSNIERAAKRETDKANSRFVGTVGERISGEFEIVAVKSWDRAKFNAPWITETVYWHLMKRGTDLVTYKGTQSLGQRGEKFKGRFTVKEHETYNGAQQTKVQRPKIDERIMPVDRGDGSNVWTGMSERPGYC
jgi:hypothetical protein